MCLRGRVVWCNFCSIYWLVRDVRVINAVGVGELIRDRRRGEGGDEVLLCVRLCRMFGWLNFSSVLIISFL